MPHRYSDGRHGGTARWRWSSALRDSWRLGYGFSDFRSDLLAGAVVALVAIPLAMALAIASGVPPQYGLYTAVVAGTVVPLLGGSRFQVTGPTAAFVVILAPVAGRFGLGGLLVAGLMAGGLLLAMGFFRLGGLIQFIPRTVTAGFTAGIGFVIAVLQLKDFFGLQVAALPDRFVERVAALLHAAPTFRPAELGVGAGTLALLVGWPKVSKRIPGPLVALAAAAAAVLALERLFPGLEIATIARRFHFEENGRLWDGIPQILPSLRAPWSFPGPGGAPLTVNFSLIESLAPSALAIALLAAIESLLSAVVADGMAGTRHNPDAELAALGVGNLLGPFLGGIPATGAIARTATNIRSGARSPLAAVFHGVFILGAILLAAPLLGRVPMASLAALLILVAYHMSELRHVRYLLNVAPRSDVAVLLLCFGLTVIFDMVVGVSVGIVLASLLFMRRMSSVTRGGPLTGEAGAKGVPPPPGFALYEIAGPMFFGAIDNAIDAIASVDRSVRGVLFLMDKVPVMDVSGLVALESAIRKLSAEGKLSVLVGAHGQPQSLIGKSHFLSTERRLIRHVPDRPSADREAQAYLTGAATPLATEARR